MRVVAYFVFKAYDKDGHLLESEIEASSLQNAKQKLLADGNMVVSVKERKESGLLNFSFGTSKVGINELEFLTSELSILLNSGVKIDKGLQIIAKGKKQDTAGKLISEIAKNLKAGMPISDAFDTKEKVFDSLYLNLIAIGEKSGKLPQVFEGLATDLQFKKALKAKVTQALTYPAIILFVCIACILFVFNYIVPQMGSIFAEGDELPVYTAILLGASEWMMKYQLWLFSAIAAVIGLIIKKKDSPEFQRFFSKHALSMPVVADLIKQVERIRFNSAMSLMLNAGVKVDVAISSATKNINNQIINKSLQVANEKIKKGGNVASSLSMTPIYPDFYVSLLEVGEESGELARIFEEIANRSKTEFENWTDKITNILEPILILVMGGIVGSVVITMLLSVVSVNDISI